MLLIPQRYEFSSKSQHLLLFGIQMLSCCWYHKGTNFQANHNLRQVDDVIDDVVADTTKVRIFKQITTMRSNLLVCHSLLLIPQRYEFSSKSQQQSYNITESISCCWYHKGTNFQANHNKVCLCLATFLLLLIPQRYEFSSKSQPGKSIVNTLNVVADTTKVRIFKQITTNSWALASASALLLIPQRYEFSSKSQQATHTLYSKVSCCWYHKGTNFQANHNSRSPTCRASGVVADTTKVRIFKQITTFRAMFRHLSSCCWYHKGTNFQANHNL